MTDSSVFSDVTIIIPAYNEALGIKGTLSELNENDLLKQCEILVIDDGSSDNTYNIVNEIGYENTHCIRHKKNKGYGGAIITGCKSSTRNIVCWYDADGQHRPEDLVAVIQCLHNEQLDYCIGVRGKDSHCDKSRKLGKIILKIIVNILAKEKMNDFNSGMRAFRKSILVRYLSLLPKRFGASTVTSFIMQEENYTGGEVPIIVRKRIGKSTVRQFRDGMRTLQLIMNIIILFRPREVFGTIGIASVFIGLVYGIVSALTQKLGIPVLSAIIIIFGIQTLFFGIISGQISQLRLEGSVDERRL